MNNPDLSKPTRQSVKGLILIFIIGVRQSIRIFWPLILVVVFQEKILENKLVLGIIGVVIFTLLITHTILYYLNFYFYVSNGEFILKKGYLRKKVLAIPLDRIQSVNTKQNILQQLLNVVTLEIDTAGSVGKELKVHALAKSFATELQNQLRAGTTKKATIESSGQTETQEISEKLILKLSPIDLLKIGISQNHFRTALIILAFGFQIFNKIQDIYADKTEEYSNELANYLSQSNWALIIFLIVFFLVVSILFSLFRTVFKYFEFKLVKQESAYRIEAGLLNKRNVVLPYSKIQELNWETGPIKKLFGIYHLVFKQAVSAQNKRVQLVDAPGCLTKHLNLLKTDLFGDEVLSDIPKISTNSYYFRRLWIIFGWIPVLLISPFFYSEWLLWVGVVVWLLITGGYSFLILKKRYFRMNSNQIRISKGAISHKFTQMELFKIQSVEFRQTIFQKRRSLATLKLMNASGSMIIPYIDESMAKHIYNYLLYHTEISEKRWM